MDVPADALRIGGFVPFSSVDWPGQLAGVLFVQGCPWRCGYCHNPHLQPREMPTGPGTDWGAVRAWLQRRRGLIDGLVFSGGEPTLDPAIVAAVAEVKTAGFAVGLHTAGMYPARLEALLPHLDWVGLDIKAPLQDGALHDRITGREGSAVPVRESLALLRASGVDFECRTTAHSAWLDDAALRALGDDLARAGAPPWALQMARPVPGTTLPPLAAGYPAADTWVHLQARVPRLALRRG